MRYDGINCYADGGLVELTAPSLDGISQDDLTNLLAQFQPQVPAVAQQVQPAININDIIQALQALQDQGATQGAQSLGGING